MRKGGGKAKGSQFEREVCVKLSRWLTLNTQEDVFWRSAMSGGRATVAAKKGKRHASQVGDISCIDPVGYKLCENFAIECKFYADLNYAGLLTGKGKLLEFWDEIKKQADTVQKRPMLFARQNRMPTFICFDKAGLATLGLRPEGTHLISPAYNIYLVSADYFFAYCPPFKGTETLQ